MSSKKYQDLSQLEKENLAKKQASKISYSNIFGKDESQLEDQVPSSEIQPVRRQREYSSPSRPIKKEEVDVLSKEDLAKIKKLILSISNNIKNIDVSLPKDKKTVLNMKDVFVLIRTIDNFKDVLQIGEKVKSKYIDLIDILKGILESPEILSNFSRTQSTWNKIKKDYLKLTKSSNIIKDLVSPPDFPLSNAEEIAKNLNVKENEIVKLVNLRSSIKIQINKLLNEYGGILRDLDALSSKYEKDVKSLEDKINNKFREKKEKEQLIDGKTDKERELEDKFNALKVIRDEFKLNEYDPLEVLHLDLGDEVTEDYYKKALTKLQNYDRELQKIYSEKTNLNTEIENEEKSLEKLKKDLQVLEKKQKKEEAANNFIINERIKKQDEERKKIIEIDDKEKQLLDLEKRYKSVLEMQGRGMYGGIAYNEYIYGKIHPTEKGQFKAKGIYDMLLEIEDYSSQANDLMEELNSRIYEGRSSTQRIGNGLPRLYKTGGGSANIDSIPRKFR